MFHCPAHLSLTRDVHTVQIELSIHEKPGHMIARLEATDEDVGPNAAIQFLLVDGPVIENFKLQPKTGELFLQRPLTKRDQGGVKLTVLAVDNGANSRTATATIHVLIKDIPAIGTMDFSTSSVLTTAGQTDNLFGMSSLFGGTGLSSNKFIIICIVLITIVICTILVAVIFIVSRGGCATYLGRSKLLSPKSKDAQRFTGQMSDGTMLTTPKSGQYPEHCQLGSTSLNDRMLNGYLTGSDTLHAADSYGLVQPMYTNYSKGASYDFDQKSHDMLIKNHTGYSGPNIADLERVPGEEREIMSMAGFTSTDTYPVSPNLRSYTGPSTGPGPMDSLHYRPTMSPFPSQETPLSTVAALPYSRATDLDGISFTGALGNGGTVSGGGGDTGLSSGGHTFSRFELRNHAINSTGFMNEHMQQHHLHHHFHTPQPHTRGPPFSGLMPSSLIP
ncbi:unnamed protein product [Echinostoma caproni]|uniref:CA domain-containing protein n=1 Tax=Echinostoma caproni TaxID=27848 RepID=A0A183AKJ4_9TREM|nr:unnamed protein product [Echinostoma caproni]